MENNFEKLLQINAETCPPGYIQTINAPYLSFSASTTYDSSTGQQVQPMTPSEVNQIVLASNEISQKIPDLIEGINALQGKIELYDKVFAAMFGKKDERDQFIDYIKNQSSGEKTDNFQLMKIMDAFNKIRPIERKEVETVDG